MNHTTEPYSPILPYDVTYGENFKIYDNTKYVQDKALCGGEDSIRMISGNVYKYYTVQLIEPCKIGGSETN
ncbi:MAG: hypothetical protein PUC65_08940 [Clostridiales bacterium]|nr:hypothetical protein [Clostridiales bacterium]